MPLWTWRGRGCFKATLDWTGLFKDLAKPLAKHQGNSGLEGDWLGHEGQRPALPQPPPIRRPGGQPGHGHHAGQYKMPASQRWAFLSSVLFLQN